jgi:uncharacterized membrane protein YGL010W
MVDLLLLDRRVLRAYQIGRFGMAARVLCILVPLATLCVALSHRRALCASIAVALALAAIGLRWRNRAGVEQVRLGLLTGLFPLTVAILIGRLEVLLGRGLGCTVICVLCAFVGGLWLGTRMAERPAPLGERLTVIVIACATASLGCLNLGVSGMTGIAFGIALAAMGVAWSRVPA